MSGLCTEQCVLINGSMANKILLYSKLILLDKVELLETVVYVVEQQYSQNSSAVGLNKIQLT